VEDPLEEPDSENSSDEEAHPLACSTPTIPKDQARQASLPKDLRIKNRLEDEGRQFSFEEGARNMRRIRARRLSFNAMQEVVPPEPPGKAGTWKWKAKEPRKFKFIDDGTFISKVNMTAILDTVQRIKEKEVRYKRDVQTENVLRRTIERAQVQGMKFNVAKTAMLAVSDAISYRPVIFLIDGDGERLESKEDSIRILGFHFDGRPSVSCHIKETIRKTRKIFWILRHLKKLGMNEDILQPAAVAH
jgi:hypothetical protein